MLRSSVLMYLLLLSLPRVLSLLCRAQSISLTQVKGRVLYRELGPENLADKSEVS